MILPSAKLGERLAELSRRATVELVDGATDLLRVYKLRYACYRREGIIEENFDEVMLDNFEHIENKYTFLVVVNGSAVSSIRVHVLASGRDISPTQHAFPEVIESLKPGRNIIIDPNRFVVDHAASRAWPELPYFTLRLPYLVATAHAANIALAAVRREHMPFYSRTLNYSVVSSPRPYPTLTKPLSLMISNFRESDGGVLNKFPFLRPTTDEICWLKGEPHYAIA